MLSHIYKLTASKSTIKMSTPPPTGLFTLPPELRLQIYEHIFTSTPVHQQGVGYNGLAFKLTSPPGILLASKSIYNEAIKTFYATTPFHFHISAYAARWIHSIRRERLLAVGEIVLHMEVPPPESYLARLGKPLDTAERTMELEREWLERQAERAGVVFGEGVVRVVQID